MAKKPTGGDGVEKGAAAKPVRKPRVRKVVSSAHGVAEGGKAVRAKAAAKPRKPRATVKKPKQIVDFTSQIVEPIASVVAVAAAAQVEAPAPETTPVLPVESPVEIAPEPVAETPAPPPEPTPEPTPAPTPAAAPAHDHELAHGLSPVDLPVPEEGEQAGLGWMAGIIILSSLLLALFNSFAIDKWARALPVSEHSGQIMDAAAEWHGAMDRIDFNLPLESGRTAWHWVKALQWPGSDSAPANAADGEAAEAGAGA